MTRFANPIRRSLRSVLVAFGVFTALLLGVPAAVLAAPATPPATPPADQPTIPRGAIKLNPAKENQAYESKKLSAQDPKGVSKASIAPEDAQKLAEYNLEFVATPLGKNLYETLPNHTLVNDKGRYELRPGTYEGYAVSFRTKAGTVVAKSGIVLAKVTLVDGLANRKAYTFAITIAAAEKFTVHFDAQGGTGTMPDVTDIKEGSSYTLPACGFVAPEGKIFAGWLIGAAQHKPGDKITAAADIATDKTIVVKAVWADKPAPTPPAPNPPAPTPDPPAPNPPTPPAPNPPAPTPDPTPGQTMPTKPATKPAPKSTAKPSQKAKSASLPKTVDITTCASCVGMVTSSTLSIGAAVMFRRKSQKD